MAANFTTVALPFTGAGAGYSGIGQGYDGKADVQLTVDGGNIMRGSDRFRIVGINLTKTGNFPAKTGSPSEAATLAHRLRAFGINCVRLFHLDQDEPNGVCNTYPALGSTKIDLMENFINELKNAGIYVNLGFHVISAETNNNGDQTAAVMFMPEPRKNYKTFVANMLERTNPYTGLKWGEDPCIGILEIINEHGMLADFYHSSNKVDNYTTAQKAELKAQWNEYLKDKYGQTSKVEVSWGSTGDAGTEGASIGDIALFVYNNNGTGANYYKDKTTAAKTDWVNFLISIENDFITDMKAYFQQRSSALITAGQVNYMANQVAAKGDIIDVHIYYDRPTKTNTASQKTTVMSLGTLDFYDNAHPTLANRIKTSVYNLPVTNELTVGTYFDVTGTTSNNGTYSVKTVHSPIEIEVNETTFTTESIADLSLQNVTTVTRASWNQANAPYTTFVNSTFGQWGDGACTQQKGKPFIITEANYGGFNFYGAEQMAFYFSQMAYQDMDGVFFFNYTNSDSYDASIIVGDLVFDKTVNKMIPLAQLAHAFTNGHILPAIDEVNHVMSDSTHTSTIISYDQGQPDVKISRNPAGGSATYYAQSNLLRRRMYTTPGENDSLAGAASGPALDPATSDTNQLVFDNTASAERIIIKSPKTKAFIGYVNASSGVSLGDGVTVDPPLAASNDWYSIIMTQLTGNSVLEGGKFIISAMGECKNSNLTWNSEATDLNDWGTDGVDSVQVDLQASTIKLPNAFGTVTVYPLDATGARGAALTIVNNGGLAQVNLPNTAAWFEMVIDSSIAYQS